MIVQDIKRKIPDNYKIRFSTWLIDIIDRKLMIHLFGSYATKTITLHTSFKCNKNNYAYTSVTDFKTFDSVIWSCHLILTFAYLSMN